MLMPAFSYSTQLDPLTAHAHIRIETYPHKLFNTGGKKNHQSHDDEVFCKSLAFFVSLFSPVVDSGTISSIIGLLPSLAR